MIKKYLMKGSLHFSYLCMCVVYEAEEELKDLLAREFCKLHRTTSPFASYLVNVRCCVSLYI